jgi:hypothetical protein
MSIWDDPDVKPVEGEFVRFDAVGDGISGHITALGKHTFPATMDTPEKTCAQISITDDNGESRILTAAQMRLVAALAEQRPDVGDHLAVTLTQIEKRGTRTLKHFDVVTTRGGKTAVTAGAAKTTTKAAAVDDEPPF